MAKKKSTPKKKTNINKKETNKKAVKTEVKEVETKKQSNKKQVKTNYSPIIGIIKLLIAFLIVGVLLYFVYINFIVIKEPSVTSQGMSSSDKEELAKQKFMLFNSKHNIKDSDLVFFTSKDLDVNTIDNRDILYFAYTMLSNEDKNNSNCDSSKYNCDAQVFDKKVLEEQVHNYFDIDDVKHEDFDGSSSIECKIKDEAYECTNKNSDYHVSEYSTVSNYLSSKIEGDKLIIKSTLLTIRRNKNKEYQEGIYKDAAATQKIDGLNYFLNDLEGLISSESSEKLSKKYEKEIAQYETTFVLKNKNYVWQSTKIIK